MRPKTTDTAQRQEPLTPHMIDTVPVTYGSGFAIYDRGEEIWLMITTSRPGQAADGPPPERWLVMPRSGAITSLVEALGQLMPQHRNGFATKGH